MGEYAALRVAAAGTVTRIFFADEAHFQADADLRGKWVLKGEPARVDSTSPRPGEKVSYYSAVCLETGEVEVMELEGNPPQADHRHCLPGVRQWRTGATRPTADGDPGQLPSPSVPPQGGSQAPLPNRAASKSRRSSWRHPSRPPPLCECRFHLGFSLARSLTAKGRQGVSVLASW